MEALFVPDDSTNVMASAYLIKEINRLSESYHQYSHLANFYQYIKRYDKNKLLILLSHESRVGSAFDLVSRKNLFIFDDIIDNFNQYNRNLFLTLLKTNNTVMIPNILSQFKKSRYMTECLTKTFIEILNEKDTKNINKFKELLRSNETFFKTNCISRFFMLKYKESRLLTILLMQDYDYFKYCMTNIILKNPSIQKDLLLHVLLGINQEFQTSIIDELIKREENTFLQSIFKLINTWDKLIHPQMKLNIILGTNYKLSDKVIDQMTKSWKDCQPLLNLRKMGIFLTSENRLNLKNNPYFLKVFHLLTEMLYRFHQLSHTQSSIFSFSYRPKNCKTLISVTKESIFKLLVNTKQTTDDQLNNLVQAWLLTMEKFDKQVINKIIKPIAKKYSFDTQIIDQCYQNQPLNNNNHHLQNQLKL